MKVLFNSYPVAFACPGGGEVQLLQTKNYLNSLNVETSFFDQWNPQFQSVDLIHYFSTQGGSLNFCGYVKKINKPLAISPILWTRSGAYDMREIKKVLDTASILLPNSDIESNVLSEDFDIPLEKFHTVHNGIDESFFNSLNISPEKFRKEFNIQGPFFLNVANIEHRKNQTNLAKALINFKGDHQLILIGNCRDHKYLDEIIKIGNGRIRYIGYIDHHSELLKSAYLACDGFVLPSLLETPGLAALEAAALGCNILITSEGSTKEYFEDKAIYVNPNSTESITEGLEKLANTPENINLIETMRKFTWLNSAKQTLEAYKKIC